MDPQLLFQHVSVRAEHNSLRPHTKTKLLRIGGDILAGLTIASMLIPQSVSYATSLAKISPVTGLVRSAGPCSQTI